MSEYQANIVIKNPATPTGPSTYGSAPGMWKLNEVAYWIKQGVWPNPAIVPDTYFPYVSLLLSTTSLSNANNNLFVDSSGAFNPVSRFGNTTQGSATPYSTNWSNYFDGSGDYLDVTSNAAFGLGTGDFTIEMWVFPTANPTNGPGTIFDLRTGPTASSANSRINSSLQLLFYNGPANNEIVTGTVSLNTWTHIAFVRSSGSLRTYVNGTLSNTSTVTSDLGSSQPCFIGVNRSAGYEFNGNISNFRIVKGTAVYTSNFTVPTAPLTAISGTSILTCQSNRFRDASSNNFTITVTGNTSVTDFGPFSPGYPGISYNQSNITNWSGFFDGTGDYLSVANSSANNLGTNDFTIELWFQSNTGTMNTHACLVASYSSPTSGSWAFKAQSGNSGYIQFASYGPSWNDWVTTTNIASDRQWHHCAVTRSGNTLRIFVDGTVRGTWDISGASSFTGGGHPLTTAFMAQDSTSYLNGNLSNVRIVQGTALYTSNFTPPTSALTAISGTVYLTCQNPAFTDNSTNNFVITQNGNPTVAGNSPFNTVGYWSNYFDGSNDYLGFPNNTALQMGSGDFTVEGWVFLNSYNGSYGTIISTSANATSSNGFGLIVSSAGLFRFFSFVSTTYVATGTTIPLNQWTHVAATRSSGTLRLFVNGVLSATASNTDNFNGDTSGGGIGGWVTANAGGLDGYISNLRMVKGTAVYTAAFTPPTAPLTAISGTSLLTCQNGRFIDNSTNAFTITPYGNASVQSFDPFYTATIASNGGSMYFDGTSDYLTSPTSPAYNFGSDNFTIEGWFYFTNSTANALQTLYSNYTSFSPAGSIFFGKHTIYSGYLSVWFSSYSTGSALLVESTYPPNNAWTHYALVRNGNTFTLYRNGVVSTSASWSGAATAGSCPAFIGAAGDALTSYNFPGYMSDFRITKSAVYTAAFTPPAAPLTPSANTTLLLNGMNAGVYDATTINDIETAGNAQVTTAVSKYGGSSMYFDGSGDYLSMPTTSALQMNGSFTWEAWVYPLSLPSSGNFKTFWSQRATLSNFGGPLVVIDSAGNLQLYIANAAASTWSVSGFDTNLDISLNNWQHLALVKNGTTVTLYKNGVAGSSTTHSTAVGTTGNTVAMAGAADGGQAVDGYMDDFRITNGVARYTSNFTPPTQPFPIY